MTVATRVDPCKPELRDLRDCLVDLFVVHVLRGEQGDEAAASADEPQDEAA